MNPTRSRVREWRNLDFLKNVESALELDYKKASICKDAHISLFLVPKLG